MIDPQAEAIKRLIAMAKSGAQRRQLVPAVTQDLTSPPVGTLWIREDEQKAYLQTAPDTALLVATAEVVPGGTEGTAITDRSLAGIKLMLNTVTTDELATDSVTSAELAPGAVDGEAFASLVNANSAVKFFSTTTTSPALTLDAAFDHATDVFRVLRDGVQRLRIDETHVSIGQDLPQSAVSIHTSSTDNALRIRGSGGAILAERQNGTRLFSVDASGNMVVAGAISSLSGNSDTAGSLSINGALTVTDQVNMLSGLSVTGRIDARAEMDIDGRATFNAEPFLPGDYSAKVGEAVHLRTSVANADRIILEGVTSTGVAEIQLGTGGPVLRGSLAQNDRMFIGADRIVTSAASGIHSNQIATDTITGGTGPNLGNIAAETITGYNIKNSSITSTELSPGAVVAGAIAAGAVGEVQLADGSVIDRVVASLGVGKLVSGTLNADEVFMGPSGHIYLGPTFASEITDARIQIDASGIRAYNSFNTPLAEFTPGGFTLRTGVDGARLAFSAASGLELFGAAGERNGYLSPLGLFQLDSAIDGARMRLDSAEGVQFYAGATKNLAYNPGFIGGSEHELAVAAEASNDQRHVFAGEYAVKFRSTNPNVTAPSYVDVPFKNTVGTGQNVTRTQVNYCPNPSVATASTGWIASAATAQVGSFGEALGFINDRAVQVTATAAGAAFISAPLVSTTGSVQWALSCSVRVSTAMNVTADILWFDVNSALIRTDVSTPFALKTNIVTQIGLVAVAPSNATTVRLRTSASLQITDKLEVSNVLYERTSGIGPYFDGYQAGYQWDGTPGNSTTSLIPVPVLDSSNNLVSIFVWSDVNAWAQIEGRDSTAGVSRGLSVAQLVTANQWSRITAACVGKMDKVRLHYPSTDPARQSRITKTPVWWSGLQVEADKVTATPFCSGNEPGCKWEGLEAKSASIRSTDVIVTRISPTLGTHVSGAIVGGSLTSASFFAGRIFGTYIEGGTLKGNIITGNQINGTDINAGTIQGTSISARTIDASNIKTGTLTATEISAATITGDKIAAGTLTATNITGRSITADKLVAGTITATEIQAGAITATKLASTLLLSSTVIAGASTTGARIQLTSGGIEGFRSNGTKSLDFNTVTGDMTVAGVYRSGDGGERIQINVDGTQDFFNSSGAISGKVENNGTSGLTFRGSASDYYLELTSSRIGLWSGPKTGTRDAQLSVNDRNIDSRAPVIGLRVSEQFSSPDGVERRVVFIQTNSSGSDRSDSIIHYYRRSVGNPLFIRPGNSGIVFDNAALAVVDGSGTSHGPIVASAFNPPSSEQLKEDVTEIVVPNERTSWDIIEGAPALDWKYISERPELRGDKPRDSDGNAIKLRRRKLDTNGTPLPDMHPDAWEYVDAEFSAPPKPRRKHRFPLAEDLFELDSQLVEGTPNDPERMTVDLRDMVGLLWDAVDMLIKRNRVIEQKLTARFPNLDIPSRPQKGDVAEGIGALIQGRTRRSIDTATGQIPNRRRTALND